MSGGEKDLIRKTCPFCLQEFSAYKEAQWVCNAVACRLEYSRHRYGTGEGYKRRYTAKRIRESQCLRCDQVFMTDDPIGNRICPYCTQLNRAFMEDKDEMAMWF